MSRLRHKKEKKRDKERVRERRSDKDGGREDRDRSAMKKKSKDKERERERDRKSDGEKGDVKVSETLSPYLRGPMTHIVIGFTVNYIRAGHVSSTTIHPL